MTRRPDTALADLAGGTPIDGAAQSSLVGGSPLPNAARSSLADVYLFTRLSVFGFTAMLPLAGALASTPRIDPKTLAGLLAIATSFHIFAYVLNDLVDLELDRREPQRSRDPLVRGKVSPAAALALVLAQPPLALAMAVWLDADPAALLALGGAFAGLAAYDLWGKRCAIPPLLELVQGLGWACLALFGAVCVAAPTARVFWLCGAIIGYVMLVNAVHGSVRDLANDLACGARTTAIYLGAHFARGTRALVLPMRFVGYAIALHAALLGAVLAMLGRSSGDVSWWIAACLLALALAACVHLSLTAYLRRHESARAESAGVRHLFVAMTLPAIPLVAHAELASAAAVAIVLALPALATWTYRRAVPA